MIESSHPLRPWTHRLALLVVLATLVMLLAGGATTTMKSGDSEPDWSFRFWEWFRAWSGLGKGREGPFYELSHRQVGTVLGFLMLWLLGFLWRSEPRAWVRRSAILAFVLMVLQGILGGVRVLLFNKPEYRSWAEALGGLDNARIISSMVHAGLGYALFSLLCAIAWATAERKPCEPQADARTRLGELRCGVLWTSGAIFVQLMLGAWVRHAGLGIPLVLLHVLGALPVALFSVWLAAKARESRDIAPLVDTTCFRLLVLVQVQVLLGIATYVLFAFASTQSFQGSEWVYLDPWVRTAHQVLGAVILAYTVVAALRIFTAGASAPIAENARA
jgi:cytochrome c oxidase assembly protein subunit 15